MTEKEFRRAVVRKFIADRELVREQLAITPKCPLMWHLFRMMPMVAPTQAVMVQAMQAARN